MIGCMKEVGKTIINKDKATKSWPMGPPIKEPMPMESPKEWASMFGLMASFMKGNG